MVSYLSMKTETVSGTYVGSHDFFVDCMDEKFGGGNDIQIPEGIRRGRRRAHEGAWLSDNGGFSMPADYNSMLVPLHGVLGGRESEVVLTTSNEHVMWGAENVPTYSVDVGMKAFMTKQMAGCPVNKLSLDISAQRLANMSMDMPFYDLVLDNSTAVSSPAYYGYSATEDDDYLVGFNEATAYILNGSIGGDYTTGDAKYLTTFKLDITNNIDPTYILGRRSTLSLAEGGRVINGSFEMLFEDEQDAAPSWVAESETLEIMGIDGSTSATDHSVADALRYATLAVNLDTGLTAGDGPATQGVLFYMPKVAYPGEFPTLQGSGRIQQTVNFECFEDTITTDPYVGVAYSSVPSQADLMIVATNDDITEAILAAV